MLANLLLCVTAQARPPHFSESKGERERERERGQGHIESAASQSYLADRASRATYSFLASTQPKRIYCCRPLVAAPRPLPPGTLHHLHLVCRLAVGLQSTCPAFIPAKCASLLARLAFRQAYRPITAVTSPENQESSNSHPPQPPPQISFSRPGQGRGPVLTNRVRPPVFLPCVGPALSVYT